MGNACEREWIRRTFSLPALQIPARRKPFFPDDFYPGKTLQWFLPGEYYRREYYYPGIIVLSDIYPRVLLQGRKQPVQ
jgi:hypothetical protein